ncbi:MAG: presenilin family intramembrane aspartyl protease [Candidatus Diapherotrites archaeon]
MKHNLKITLILLAMFLVTQFIGLYVVNHYLSPENKLPYGMEIPEAENNADFYTSFFPSIIIAFVIAVILLILFTRFKLDFILKLWFFLVVLIALGIFLTSVLPDGKYVPFLALILVLPLALIKIYRRNFLVHNATELFIYPSIAAVFVPLLNFWTVIILLILISIYDMWAVWRSGIMQKMAKYQMNNLKVFAGFFVPYISKKVRGQLKNLSKSELRKKKIKAHVAILGGGDVIFPIITAGVMLKEFGFLSALFVIIGAALGLSYLFFFAEKKKFYPAMPFITIGILFGILVSQLVL